MYIVVEIQIFDNRAPNVLHFEYEDRNRAYEKYHYILAEAAVSEVLIHTAVIMQADGRTITRETFEHPRPTEVGETNAD